MKFSVVIPVYNRAHSIAQALQSVLDQTRPADEIIIVDDGSTDNLEDALAAFRSRIVLVRQPNAGVAAARNLGAEKATGDWLTFQDSDDLWTSDHLAVVERDLAQAGPDVVTHIGDVVYAGKGYSRSLFSIKRQSFPQGRARLVDDPLPLVISGMTLQAAAIRKDIFWRVGGFDTKMRIAEDTALFCQIAIEGKFLVTGDLLAKIQRLEGDSVSLSIVHGRNVVYSRTMAVRVLEHLVARPLSPGQRALVNRKLSGAEYCMAQVMAETSRREAWPFLVRSARHHPSALKGWGKALLPALLGPAGYRIALRDKREIDRT